MIALQRHALTRWLGGAVLALGLMPVAVHAEWLMLCDRETGLNATQQDRLYRFAAIIKNTLQAQRGPGQDAVLMARSGLNLARFGQRYSHMGIGLADLPDERVSAQPGAIDPLRTTDSLAWTVRQLYYACQEHQPRLFDQGVAGFVLGTAQPELGYVSVLILPPEQAVTLRQLAADKAQALSLLGARYSANAYPFATRYQNCNQWVAEMLARAWAPTDAAPQTDETRSPRRQAQDWLRDQGYAPTTIDVGPWLMWAAPFVPFVHSDDHPEDDLGHRRYLVSLPQAIEAFVQAQVPAVRRIEFCHAGARVVIHEGWSGIAEGCLPGDGDTVITLE